jgi:hypothetical protein
MGTDGVSHNEVPYYLCRNSIKLPPEFLVAHSFLYGHIKFAHWDGSKSADTASHQLWWSVCVENNIEGEKPELDIPYPLYSYSGRHKYKLCRQVEMGAA